MVAAKSGSEQAKRGCEFWTDEQSANRKSVAHSFCHSNNIRLDAVMLVCKELSGTPVAALDFVDNQDNVIGIAEFFQFLKKIGSSFVQSANTLDSFDDDCRNFIF